MFRGWSQIRKYLTSISLNHNKEIAKNQINAEIIPLLFNKVDNIILKRKIINRVIERLVQQALLNAMHQHRIREETLYQSQIQEENDYLNKQREKIKQQSIDLVLFSHNNTQTEEASNGYCSIQ